MQFLIFSLIKTLKDSRSKKDFEALDLLKIRSGNKSFLLTLSSHHLGPSRSGRCGRVIVVAVAVVVPPWREPGIGDAVPWRRAGVEADRPVVSEVNGGLGHGGPGDLAPAEDLRPEEGQAQHEQQEDRRLALGVRGGHLKFERSGNVSKVFVLQEKGSKLRQNTRLALTQFYGLKIHGSTNFMSFRSPVRRISKLKNCERARRVKGKLRQ